MPRNGRCTGPRNPARARSRYATSVDEAILRAAADGTRTGNFQIGRWRLFVAFQPKQPCDLIVTERVHFSAMTSETDRCFLQLLSDLHRFRRQIDSPCPPNPVP